MQSKQTLCTAIAWAIFASTPAWSQQTESFDRAEPFVPKRVPSVEETKQIEADKLFMIGYMYERKQSLTLAVENYAKAIAMVPTHLATLKRIVPLYQDMGRTEEAMTLCRRAIEIAPNDPGLLHVLAQQAYQRGELDAAINALLKLTQSADFRRKNPRQFYDACVELQQLCRVAKDYKNQASALKLMMAMVGGPELNLLNPQIQRNSGIMLGEIYRSLGECYLADSKPQDAIEILKRAKSLEGAMGRFGVLLADAYFQAGDLKNAMNELDAFRSRKLADPRCPALLEKILVKQGKKDQVLATLEEWLNDDRSNVALRRFYVEKLMDAKKFAAARDAIKDDSGAQSRREYMPLLARLYREMNEPAELLKLLVNSIQLQEPNTYDAELMLLAKNKELYTKMANLVRESKVQLDEQSTIIARRIIADTAREAKDWAVAKEFLEKAIQANPIDNTNYISMAVMLWQAEKFEELHDFCKQSISKFPGDGVLQGYWAQSLLMLGRSEEAMKAAENWVAKASSDEASVNDGIATLIWICERTKQWDKALQIGENAMKQAPTPQMAERIRYLLTNVYTLKGDDAKAESELQKLIDAPFSRIDERIRVAANNDLGYLWADKSKNLDKAEKYIRFAVSKDPDNYSYLDSLGWVLFRKGKLKEAFEYLERANQLQDGSDPTIWDHVGDVHLQLGRPNDAKVCWQKAADLYSKHPRERNEEKHQQVQRKLKLLASPNTALPKRAAPNSP